MAINIFDDEVLKRNKSFISETIEEDKTSIEKNEDTNKTEFGVLYDFDQELGIRKALEDPKRSIEIPLSSAQNRTPNTSPVDTRIDEISFDKFIKEASGKWGKLTSPTPGITKDNISIDLANREELTNSFSLTSELENTNREVLVNETEISSTNENKDFTYNEIYENDFWKAENWFGEGRATRPGSPVIQNSVDASDLEIRENSFSETRARELSIFLFMLFPYIGSSTVLNIRNAIASPDVAGLAISASQSAAFLLQNMKYFTPAELAKYFLHNFYTLHFMKEMTIKLPPGRFSSGAPIGQEWSGRPDIFFGRGSSALLFLKQLNNLGSLFKIPREDLGDGSQFLTQYKDGGDGSGNASSILQRGAAVPLSPQIRILGSWNSSKRKTSPTDILGDSNPMEETINTFIVSIPNLQIMNGKWRIESFGSNMREDIEGTREYYKTIFREMSENQNEYLVNREALNSRGYSLSSDNGKWNEIPDKISQEQTSSISSRDATRESNLGDNLINPEALNSRGYSLSSENGKWNEIPGSISEEQTDSIVSRDATRETNLGDNMINPEALNSKNYSLSNNNGKWNEIPEGISEQDTNTIVSKDATRESNLGNNMINSDVLSINLAEFKYLDGPPQGPETIREAIKRRSNERRNVFDLQVGSILVAPVVSDSNILPRFHIPFEFNPEIAEGSLEARYEATEVLSRIGELQSYSGTNSLTITLDTQYIATAHAEENEVGTDGNNWMSDYTLEKIQAIEKAYRSLLLPHFPDETSIDQGYTYIKPPLLRVIIGGANDDPEETGPYANLLTYGRNSMVEGRLNSSQRVFNSRHSRLKSFIATSLTITKDMAESPLILDKKGRIKDTIGFSVSLSLTEVTANYMDSIPDFKRYSDEYRRTMESSFVNNIGE